MYKIKQIPEDFVVREKTNVKFSDEGDFSYFLLKKRNYTTLRAVQAIATYFKIPTKFIGFAGTKDKNAITEQFISIKTVKKEASLKDISMMLLKL
ncbi:tRNA pseudouridine(13) synthase TruD [Nanoarchaeota archaeon]